MPFNLKILSDFTSAIKTTRVININTSKGKNPLTMGMGQCVPIVMDLSVAFDTVNHSLLLSRLENSFGITGAVLQWFHSYLTGRSQFVEINDTKSSVTDLTVGVPQGSVLGPILYLLYTAPLAEIIKSHGLVYHFYAEDAQFYITSDCDDVARLCIENCVTDICHWMDVNELKLNHNKTEIILIYSKYNTRPLFTYFSICSERLTYLMTTCYLMCTSQTFADHRLTSLGIYQRLENISHRSLVKLLCMLS